MSWGGVLDMYYLICYFALL
uniref:Uncharacterized protein n=1 Tax=Arundo donax TaxID=35708 RepID=A0A0A8ZN31_ARUDO